MRGGGFLIAAFTFGVMAAASQSSITPQTRVVKTPTADNLAYVYIAAPPAVSEEPSGAITSAVPEPRPKPGNSASEAERLRRLHLFDLRQEAKPSSHFRAGPRGTVTVAP